MIVKKENIDGVMVYHVRKEISDEKIELMLSKYATERSFNTIIDHDADIYDADTGKIVAKFRKNVLIQKHVDDFYENIIKFAHNKSGLRGIASGSKEKGLGVNNKIASNIIGYFDGYTVFQKHIFKTLNIKPPSKVRLTRFTMSEPEKWNKCIPLIQDIDKQYKKLAPKEYKFQRSCADQTAFKIPNTAFSTVTTNLTYHTSIHRDGSNLEGTLGNIVVIEKGKYTGGHVGYPQYKVALDVRTGDIAIMDIHVPHANTPIRKLTKDAERLSLVSYLREGIYEHSKGTTEKDVENTKKKMQNILKRFSKVVEANKQVANKI
jgi:hypothetical protein